MKNVLVLLFFSWFANAQIVNIPDANFKNVLLQTTPDNSIARDILGNGMAVDANSDGEIQLTEALQVYQLFVQGDGVANFQGIGSFSNLTVLYCNYNPVNSLDLTGLVNLTDLNCSQLYDPTIDLTVLPALETVTCYGGGVTSINVSGLVNLKTLYCYDNLLTTLDVSNLPNLELVNCMNNSLNSIDLSDTPNLIELNCRNNDLATFAFSNTGLTQLNCINNNLASLNVSSLAATLTELYCGENQLTSIDLSLMQNLTNLDCRNNQLTAIDVSTLQNLAVLACDGNFLTELDVTALSGLQSLFCSGNQLDSLDLTTVGGLEALSISDNLFTSFDFSVVPNLTSLGCSGNPITVIDVSMLTQLSGLDCRNTLITTLDISDCPNICGLYVDDNPQLVSLFLKNGYLGCDGEISFNNCPNLAYICTDEFEIPTILSYLDFYNMNNTVVNSYCSFLPGGDHNTITGTTLFDADNNGCGGNDTAQPYVKIKINDGVNEGASFVNASGVYAFYVQEGNFTVTTDIENPSLFNVTPTNTVVNFPDNNNNVSTQNFCITANGVHPDVEIVGYINPGMPGFGVQAYLYIKNKGNQVLSGNAYLQYDEDVLNFISSTPAPDLQTFENLSFDYTDLFPFETRTILITFQVHSPTDTPPVNIGDEMDFTAGINPIVGDETPNDNTIDFGNGIMGSYDPNDKTCIEGSVISVDKIGEYLHYAINFENTGTAPAQNIVVRDIINTAQFEVGSLQIIGSSHPMEARVSGNIAEFIFQGINLEIGGHGNILLKLKTSDNLVEGDEVSNKADIFFDYNFPIETNEANTAFQNLSIDDPIYDSSISIYPNPTHNIINIQASSEIKSVQVFDVQGRLLQTAIVNDSNTSIDISSKQSGVYFLKITSQNGIKTEKIIKQ